MQPNPIYVNLAKWVFSKLDPWNLAGTCFKAEATERSPRVQLEVEIWPLLPKTDFTVLVLMELWPTRFFEFPCMCSTTRILRVAGPGYIGPLTRNKIYCNFPYPAIMVVTHYTNARETPTSLSFGPEDTEDTEEALSASVPNEASALLPDGHVLASHRNPTERSQSVISSFLDKNAGLLLVASSQLFFCASNLCVKWLNSLDESERIPILEVRDILGVNRYFKLMTSNVKLIWVRMVSTSTFSSHSPS